MWYVELFEKLEQLKDIEQASKMAAYMQNKFVFLGVPKPKLSAFIKPYLKEHKKQPLDWNFVFCCWKNTYREAQYIGIEYIIMHQKTLTDKDIDNLKLIITEKSWWETVDSLDAVIGTIISKYPNLKSTMIEWSVSDNIWLRRVAIDFQQKYKENTDTKLLSEIITNNFGSSEYFINKAIGWSLRDYSKVNATWVKDFIEKNQDKMDKLSIKEAGKYL